jgi:glyoxylate utilization-related uncharacterized protein
MDHAKLTDHVRFSEEGPERSTVFESDHLWSQVICLDRNQSYGPVTDPEADALLTVLAGECAVQLVKKRKRLGQWGAVLVPARSPLSVTNASADPLVLLLVTAPPPAPATPAP